jgi:hypothetical protein
MHRTGLAVGNGGALSDIAARLGRWTPALNTLGRMVRSEPHRWHEHLSRLSDEMLAAPCAVARCGLLPEVVQALMTLASYGEPLSVDELGDLSPTIGRDQFRRVLEWADLLAYATLVAAKKWQLDAFVQRLLMGGVAAP